jgi:hypothetical protein
MPVKCSRRRTICGRRSPLASQVTYGAHVSNVRPPSNASKLHRGLARLSGAESVADDLASSASPSLHPKRRRPPRASKWHPPKPKPVQVNRGPKAVHVNTPGLTDGSRTDPGCPTG